MDTPDRKPEYVSSVVKLTGDPSRDAQVVASKYAEGWVMITAFQTFPGQVIGYFHRKIDRLSEFTQDTRPSHIKALPPITSNGLTRRSARG